MHIRVRDAYDPDERFTVCTPVHPHAVWMARVRVVEQIHAHAVVVFI